jgi:hypothetical protein
MMIDGMASGLGVLASSFWLWQLVEWIRHRGWAVRLVDQPSDPPGSGWPSLAVIFAARNEAEMVGRAASSMLAQDYPGLVVIAVDDRSTDATGAILDALAAEDARLRVVHVRELPAGWLGKNHALHAAAETSLADWFLFTDADVVFVDPAALRRAVALAERDGLDHIAVAPDVPTERAGERIFLAMFGLVFAVYAPAWKVADPDSPVHIGIGAFNLVRGDPFRAIGGLRHVALSVDDDMRLGQALKCAGYRARLVLGDQAVSVRWHAGLGALIRGLEKNFFAGVDFRLGTVAYGVVAILTMGLAPYIGLFEGPWWSRAVCGVGIGAIAGLLVATGRRSGITWYHALTLPISAVTFSWALVRSTWITLRRRGVRWRDHHYPLEELRAHVRRRNAWTREVWRSTR